MPYYYDVAQVCLNGHVITDRYNDFPERRKDFCDRCGEPTIFKCPNCDSEIRGEYIYANWGATTATGKFQNHFPHFCSYCGKPFPWTERRLEAIREIICTLKIEKKECELLEASLEDLIKDTPKTSLAVKRWKDTLTKVEKTMYEAIEKVFIEIVSETVKKALFG